MRRFQGDTSGGEDETVPWGTQVGGEKVPGDTSIGVIKVPGGTQVGGEDEKVPGGHKWG